MIRTLIAALLVRPLTVAVGLLGIGWGGVCLPIFWQSAALETMASRILDGDSYQVATLTELLPTVELIEGNEYCVPAAIRSAAIVRLRLFDEAVNAGERELLDEYMSLSESSIRLALRCVPSDSFLWLALYRIVSLRNGFATNYLNYFWMSYRLGPNEGWVALKRSGNAFSIYDLLPVDLREATLTEFVGLVKAGFERETVDILEGPAWNVRDLLLARLTDVSERHRQRFANVLYRDRVDLAVPGITVPEPRPWR